MKIVENSSVLFDEFIEHVFDRLPQPCNQVKDYMKQEYAPGIIEDLYDVFYYYTNSPLMRYVNNYYQYERYEPRVFEKNMKKALHQLCMLEEERITKSTREMLAELSSISEETALLDSDLNKYHIYFVWTTEPDCCNLCKKYDGRILTIPYKFNTHWNCRCYLTQNVEIISPDGDILETKSKIL